jgi:hypothetical protein
MIRMPTIFGKPAATFDNQQKFMGTFCNYLTKRSHCHSWLERLGFMLQILYMNQVQMLFLIQFIPNVLLMALISSDPVHDPEFRAEFEVSD